jgi:hypothetical protein
MCGRFTLTWELCKPTQVRPLHTTRTISPWRSSNDANFGPPMNGCGIRSSANFTGSTGSASVEQNDLSPKARALLLDDFRASRKTGAIMAAQYLVLFDYSGFLLAQLSSSRLSR